MSLYEEKLLLKRLKASISAGLMTPCPKLSRFYRKLCVRQVSGQLCVVVHSLAFLHWVGIALHPRLFISDIAIIVLKGMLKLLLLNTCVNRF